MHKLGLFLGLVVIGLGTLSQAKPWKSEWVYYDKHHKLQYKADEKGNTVPDFGRVGYEQGAMPPVVHVEVLVSPGPGDDTDRIQAAIDKVAKKPLNKNGFRGCVLLRKGRYEISKTIQINHSGIVLRGQGQNEKGTLLIATPKRKMVLISITSPRGHRGKQIQETQIKIAQDFVPAGTKILRLESTKNLKKGDIIQLIRPGTADWIHDLKMDQIPERADGSPISQWKPREYTLHFERVILGISGNRIAIDQPVVMPMSQKYGGGYVVKYIPPQRITHSGVENMQLQSVYASETDEEHANTAIQVGGAENCWIRNITSRYFSYSLASISGSAKYISVLSCHCLDPKSIVTGMRRYSFSVNGQMILVAFCESRNGRHDYVTGPRVAGPNVFTHCTSTKATADIGPHQRWAMGILYDKIETDSSINVQDRGNYGSGHGWAGTTHVLWNCTAKNLINESPPVTGNNYCIGCRSKRKRSPAEARIWDGFDEEELEIDSLYKAQRDEAKKKRKR